MANKWRDLYTTIPPDRRERIEADVARELAEMAVAKEGEHAPFAKRGSKLQQNERDLDGCC